MTCPEKRNDCTGEPCKYPNDTGTRCHPICTRDMRSTAPWISEVLREIQEMPDRTSPADFPTAMLVTARELRGILERHAPSASRAIHIAVLRQNEKRRVVLAVYSKDATEAERVARGKYTGWSLESLKLKDDPTVFRLHDDAWLEADSVQPEEKRKNPSHGTRGGPEGEGP